MFELSLHLVITLFFKGVLESFGYTYFRSVRITSTSIQFYIFLRLRKKARIRKKSRFN